MSDVFRREMNWSTYQDKQLDVLKSLESSFGSSLNIGKSLKSNLDKTAEALDSILKSAELLAGRLKGGGSGGNRGTSADTRDPRDLSRLIEEAERKRREDAEKEDARRREAEKELEERNRRAQDYLERNQEEREKSDRQYRENMQYTLKDWSNKFFKYMGDIAKDFSDTRNAFIQNSGIIGEESQELRGTISREITRSLNRDTGDFYNPREVYKTMAKVSAEASIGNKKILEDISRPILLAQESMNVNTTELAGMFGRWSKKYNFSSMAMEEMVDDIRGNTAGNNASEAAAQETLNKLEELIVYYAGGDETKMKDMSKGLTTATAWLTDMGIDSSFYDEIMKSVFSGEIRQDTKMIAALKQAGIDVNTLDKYAKSGTTEGILEAYQYMFDGMANLTQNTMTDSVLMSQIAKNFGFELDDLLPTYNSKFNNANYQTIEEFAASNKDKPTAAETVESKHLGFMEKIVNNLDTMLEKTATFQEKLGINISEIVTALFAIKGVSAMFGGMKGGFTSLLSGSTTAGAFTKFFGKGTASLAGGLGGMLGALGPALGIGAGAVGIALIAKDIYDTVKKDDEEGADPYQGALADDGTPLYGYGYKGTYDAETGKTNWSYGALSEEEAANKDGTYRQYINDKKKNMSFWDRIKLGVGNTQVNNLAKAYGIKTWDDKQREVYDNVDTILNASAYREMVNFYQGKKLLNSMSQIDHFAENIEKYDKYWKKGMYLAGKKWYTVDGDQLVTDGAPKAFAVGSNYIDRDQLAFLHEGEAVVPKKYNPAANMNELESLRRKEKNAQKDNKSQKYLQETVETLREIKEFMAVWKDDSLRNTSLSERKNRLNTFASSYMRTE